MFQLPHTEKNGMGYLFGKTYGMDLINLGIVFGSCLPDWKTLKNQISPKIIQSSHPKPTPRLPKNNPLILPW